MSKNTLAAIVFAVSLFLSFVLIVPQYDAIVVAKEAVKSRRLLLNEKGAILDNVKKNDLQTRSRQADIDKIKSFVPGRKQIDEIVSSIQNITEQSGLQLSNLTTSETSVAVAAEYKKIFVGIDMDGSYPNFINFLKLLEQSLRLYDIFEITAATSTVKLGNINFAIKMNAYYLK